jgi:hypothetical protein
VEVAAGVAKAAPWILSRTLSSRRITSKQLVCSSQALYWRNPSPVLC